MSLGDQLWRIESQAESQAYNRRELFDDVSSLSANLQAVADALSSSTEHLGGAEGDAAKLISTCQGEVRRVTRQ